ncbi:hypothetical protein [Streptomyces sp. TLI_105]|uniref:hypothetical protein n=1 Tax=Streptomyces sp. TLI_105 TaxID=1881019 RepID=UPI00210E8C19|nr:hypothetical protein [Streptomyces sp. TLI_105]
MDAVEDGVGGEEEEGGGARLTSPRTLPMKSSSMPTSAREPPSAPPGGVTPTLWRRLALGVLFLLLGVKQWKDRSREGRTSRPPG